MSKNKKNSRRRIWWFEEWQVEEQTAWLNAMSAKGWQLTESTPGIAAFKRGKDPAVSYHCELLDLSEKAGQQRVKRVEKAGYEHLGGRRMLQVFRSKSRSSKHKLDDDNQLTLQMLGKLLQRQTISAIMIFILLPVAFFMFRSNIADFMLTQDWTLAVALFGYLYTLYLSIKGALEISKQKKRLLGQAKSTEPYYKPLRSRRFSLTLLALIVGLILVGRIGGMVTGMASDRFPAIPEGELPVVRMAEILGGTEHARYVPNKPDADVDSTKGNILNYYRLNGSLLVPWQLELHESVEVSGADWPDGSGQYQPTLRSYSYFTRSTGLARLLASELQAEWATYWAARGAEFGRVENQPEIFDDLFVMQQDEWHELIAVRGQNVYKLTFHGLSSQERLIELLAEKVNE